MPDSNVTIRWYLDLEHSSSTGTVLSFDVASVALRGRRNYQEDSLISSFPLGQDFGFAVLADGMGGHTSGHVASALVVAEVFSQLKMKDLMLDDGALSVSDTLQDAAHAANARVAAYAEEDQEAHGMGATLLSIVIRRDKLFWVSVGDSPLLLFRDGALRQLNKDHSMAPQIDMMVKAGTMSEEVGRDHPDRSTLTSAITGEEIEAIDCPSRPISLRPDDILVIASDGLQFLSNGAIARILKRTQGGHSLDIAEAFRDAIEDLANPEQDNAAFSVIKLGEGHEDRSAARELDDLPVLAMGDDDDEEDAQVEEAPAEPAVDEDRERKAYWYRGQKYYKD